MDNLYSFVYRGILTDESLTRRAEGGIYGLGRKNWSA